MDPYLDRLEEMYANKAYLNDWLYATDEDHSEHLGVAFELLQYGNHDAALNVLKNLKASYDEYVRPKVERDVENNRPVPGEEKYDYSEE